MTGNNEPLDLLKMPLAKGYTIERAETEKVNAIREKLEYAKEQIAMLEKQLKECENDTFCGYAIEEECSETDFYRLQVRINEAVTREVSVFRSQIDECIFCVQMGCTVTEHGTNFMKAHDVALRMLAYKLQEEFKRSLNEA
jgi:hypothetical protein